MLPEHGAHHDIGNNELPRQVFLAIKGIKKDAEITWFHHKIVYDKKDLVLCKEISCRNKKPLVYMKREATAAG